MQRQSRKIHEGLCTNMLRPAQDVPPRLSKVDRKPRTTDPVSFRTVSATSTLMGRRHPTARSAASRKSVIVAEYSSSGLRFKPPKTKYGRRTISLPPHAVRVLREHRPQQFELRLQLGLGKPEPDALVFCNADGTPMSPNYVTRCWQDASVGLGLPQVMFHALRHTHASALIAPGIDVVKISRRLGHADPTVTLRIYAHLFDKVDTTAASAIEVALTQDAGRGKAGER